MLLFVYDLLMTREIQELVNVDIEFLCYAKTNARIYWINDGKKKRLFITCDKKRTTKTVYGSLFKVKQYDEDKYKLHSFYNSSLPYTNCVMQEDLYELKEIVVNPIKFKKLQDFNTGDLIIGEPIKCLSFVGNVTNRKVLRNSKTSYYRVKDVDKKSFLTLIEENNNEILKGE